MENPKKIHEFSYMEELSLFNSGHRYSDGYNKAYCTCGWTSAPAKGNASIEIWKVHAIGQKEST